MHCGLCCIAYVCRTARWRGAHRYALLHANANARQRTSYGAPIYQRMLDAVRVAPVTREVEEEYNKLHGFSFVTGDQAKTPPPPHPTPAPRT